MAAKKKVQKRHTYHLGITMAGAVSAGCYTAGVMDYIYEVLDLWERAKEGKTEIPLNLVPKNDVIIDVMGGASAGGMATIMSALYALDGKINPVKNVPKDPMDSYNVLYDSWVHLNDDKAESGELTFEKLWQTNDLKNGVLSLLNTSSIDTIAVNAFSKFKDKITSKKKFKEHIKNNIPAFISKDLEILLSHTLLSGVPLSVDFKTDVAKKNKNSPKHNTYEHFLVSHFKLNKGESVDEKSYYWLNPFDAESSKKMMLSTIATGAFPIGLAYREFDQNQFNDDYVKAAIKRMIYGNFGIANPDKENKIAFENFPKRYSSTTIDGGAINNEPYAEVTSVLKERHYKKTKKHQDFGLIMIDPFPDNDSKTSPVKEEEILDNGIYKKVKRKKDILDLIPEIIGTLTNQSRIKRTEILERLSTDYFRGAIYPSKHVLDENDNYKYKEKYPIASASFGAFGGFLDINFRKHDFFLGRNNARNFLRYFGSLPYDEASNNVHPMHKDWTQEMIDTFKIPGSNGEIFLPIIPDLNLILNPPKDFKKSQYNYTVPLRPKYNAETLFALRKNIETRVSGVFTALIDRGIKSKSTAKKVEMSITETLMKKKYRTTLFGKIKSWVFKLISRITKKPGVKVISSNITKKIIALILKDLEDKSLLDKPKK